MQDNLLDTPHKTEEEPLTDGELFTKIWTKPRRVFRFVEQYKFDEYLIPLLIIAGIARGFDGAAARNLGEVYSMSKIILISVIGGALLGWISYLMLAALVSWTGKMLGGDRGTRSILRVLAYASIPTFFGLLCLVPQLLLFGVDAFKLNGELLNKGTGPLLIGSGFALLQLVFTIWSLVLAVTGISEIQGFGTGKALLNLLLPGLVFIILYMLLAPV